MEFSIMGKEHNFCEFFFFVNNSKVNKMGRLFVMYTKIYLTYCTKWDLLSLLNDSLEVLICSILVL